jgi:ganglioside-induced differentiation-associated protein 1
MIEFYQGHTSTCSGKVRLVLEEKGIEYKEINVDVMSGKQKGAEYLKLNPNGVVPTIIHDGKILIESTLIAEYLDEVFAGPTLRPSDPFELAQMRRWPKIIDEELHPATLGVTYTTIVRNVTAQAKTAEEIEESFAAMADQTRAKRMRLMQVEGAESEPFRESILAANKSFERFETGLAASGGPWFMGENYTLADSGVTPWLMRFDNIGFSGMWDDKPNLAAWWERVQKRPNFIGVVSRAIDPKSLGARAKFGAEIWPRAKEILAAG